MKELRSLPFTLAPGIGQRASIGVIVLATERTLEREWRELIDLDGVACYVNRIPFSGQATPAALREQEQHLVGVAATLRPREHLDVVAYACASGAMLIGDETVATHIRASRAGVAVTTPMAASIEGLRALGVSRIALLSPYSPEIDRQAGAYLAARGIEVVAIGSFDHGNHQEVARIDAASIQSALAQLLDGSGAEAALVACSSLRMAMDIPRMEAALGKPVLSSNQALAWHSLRLAGVDEALPAFGRLGQV